jgi:hypothetical protein
LPQDASAYRPSAVLEKSDSPNVEARAIELRE